MEEKTNRLGEAWFLVRWITGLAIDVILTAGACLTMFWLFFFYLKHPLTGVPFVPDRFLSHPLVALFISLGVFSAFMAGRQWVRTQYFTHILPEVWNDTVKHFIEEAHRQYKDDDK
jgi:hypothetical protein